MYRWLCLHTFTKVYIQTDPANIYTYIWSVCFSIEHNAHVYIPPYSFDLCIFTVLTDTHFIIMSQGAWKGIILWETSTNTSTFQSSTVANLTVLTHFLLVECCVHRFNTILLLHQYEWRQHQWLMPVTILFVLWACV